MDHKASATEEVYAPDGFLNSGDGLRSDKITVVSGQDAMVAGTVLGKITTGGAFALSLSASNDGSEVPDAILAEDLDATTEDTQALVYIAGDFNADLLTIGTGHTAADIKDGLRVKGIFIK